MPVTEVMDGETIDQALKRFKASCEKEGIFSEIKRRAFYESPSVRRKRKAIKALKRLKKRR